MGKMTKLDKINHWLKLAIEDLDFAHYSFKGKYFLNTVLFCHLTIEKAIKAAYVEVNEIAPPFIHHLIKLSKKAEIYDDLTKKQIKFLKELNPMNVKARYPEEKDKIVQKLNKQVCEEILFETKEMLEWIQNRLLK